MWRMWQQGDFGCTMLDWCIHRHIQNIIYVFLVCPILMPVFFFLFHKLTRIEYRNWPWQGFDIISIEYWMRQNSSSKLFDRESSSLSTRPDFHPIDPYFYVRIMIFFFKENVCLVQKKEVQKTNEEEAREEILPRCRDLDSYFRQSSFLSPSTLAFVQIKVRKRDRFFCREEKTVDSIFTNILRAAFSYESFFAKLFCTYSLCS